MGEFAEDEVPDGEDGALGMAVGDLPGDACDRLGQTWRRIDLVACGRPLHSSSIRSTGPFGFRSSAPWCD